MVPDVLPAWPAFLEAADPALRPFLDEAGNLYVQRWSDADHGADLPPAASTVDENPALRPVLPDEVAGKLAVRELPHPVDALPASAAPLAHGTAGEAASELRGSAVARCRQAAGRSAA